MFSLTGLKTESEASSGATFATSSATNLAVIAPSGAFSTTVFQTSICCSGGSLANGRAWASLAGGGRARCPQFLTFSATLAASINWYALAAEVPTRLE